MTVVYNCNCDDGFEHETLLSMRMRIARRINMSGQAANLGPGVAAYIDDFIREAQDLVYAENPEVFQTMRYFTWDCVQGERFYDLDQNREAKFLPTPSNVAVNALPTGGTVPAGLHGYRVAAVNANGTTLASVTAAVNNVGATSRNNISWDAVADATAYYIYGRTSGAELFIAAVTGAVFNYIDDGSITPAGALPTENTTAECRKLLSETKIEAVFISDSPGRWRKLRKGIDPRWFNDPIIESYPTNWDIRQCLEIYPAPSSNQMQVMIKGNFSLLPLVQDTDTVTIDKNLVFMRAVANIKAARGHPDAANYVAQGSNHLFNLVANMHAGERYIPNHGHGNHVDRLSGVDYGNGVLYDSNGNILRDNS